MGIFDFLTILVLVAAFGLLIVSVYAYKTRKDPK